MVSNIKIPKKVLKEFCHQNKILRLSFFGSVLRDDFTDQSDVDVLVEFEPDARIGLITLAGMEIELGRLIGQRVEIHPINGLNPRFRDEVIDLAQVQYEQT